MSEQRFKKIVEWRDIGDTDSNLLVGMVFPISMTFVFGLIWANAQMLIIFVLLVIVLISSYIYCKIRVRNVYWVKA